MSQEYGGCLRRGVYFIWGDRTLAQAWLAGLLLMEGCKRLATFSFRTSVARATSRPSERMSITIIGGRVVSLGGLVGSAASHRLAGNNRGFAMSSTGRIFSLAPAALSMLRYFSFILIGRVVRYGVLEEGRPETV